MRSFPADFSSLLNPRGLSLLNSSPRKRLSARAVANLQLWPDLIAPATAQACRKILDRHLYPLLQPLAAPIPAGSIRDLKQNYGEMLPKTSRMKTCFLHDKRCIAYSEAGSIGLLEMLRSGSLLRFAELASGVPLEWSSSQVICYESGDYAGPHNDHHPEDRHLRHGYIDLHIMFRSNAVAHQWIVWENRRHLNQIRTVNLDGAIALYRLPFWHYTTPLAPQPDREREARRWLLLASFVILRPKARLISATPNGISR
jgi:hypothetical protein